MDKLRQNSVDLMDPANREGSENLNSFMAFSRDRVVILQIKAAEAQQKNAELFPIFE